MGYEARLRKAFQKPSSLVNDLKEIFEFRKGSISAEKYFDTINKLTDKLLRHKLDKKELTKYFLIHCVDSKEIQKKIKMRGISDVTDIEKLIKKMDSISEEEEIGAVQRITYADVTKGKEKFREYQNRCDIKQSNRTGYIAPLLDKLNVGHVKKKVMF